MLTLEKEIALVVETSEKFLTHFHSRRINLSTRHILIDFESKKRTCGI